MSKIGKCPFCETGYIEKRETKINDKKINIYACSNAHWNKYIDFSELTEDSTCSYSLFSNNLLKFNKRSISEQEARNLFKHGQIKVRLYSKRNGEYFKYAIPNLNLGIEILFDVEVEDNTD